MEWVIVFMCGFCVYLFIRCMQLETQIINTESKIREEFRDTFVKDVRNMMVKLADHMHDPTTGYVDRMSIMDQPKEERGNGR
jgi:hypothetical protein